MYVCAAGNLRQHVGTCISTEGSMSGLAVRTGQTLYCEDSSTDERVDPEACARVGERSFLCLPLLRGPEPIGVLKVSAARPRAFAAGDVEIITRLAGFVSAAIGGFSELSLAATGLLDSTQDDRAPATDLRISEFVANVLRPGIVDELAVRRRIERVLRYLAEGMPVLIILGGTGSDHSGSSRRGRARGDTSEPPRGVRERLPSPATRGARALLGRARAIHRRHLALTVSSSGGVQSPWRATSARPRGCR